LLLPGPLREWKASMPKFENVYGKVTGRFLLSHSDQNSCSTALTFPLGIGGKQFHGTNLGKASKKEKFFMVPSSESY
jgi:hypothetical protein